MESEVSKHGWIPSWFPKAASQIHLQYDIDTNNRWYKFRLPKEGKENIVRNFVKLAWKQVEGIPTPKPHGADWWFEGLIQQQPANSHAALYADIYQGKGKIVASNVFLAMDETKDSVFIWICGHDWESMLYLLSTANETL